MTFRVGRRPIRRRNDRFRFVERAGSSGRREYSGSERQIWGPSRTNHLATGQGELHLWEIADIGLMVVLVVTGAYQQAGCSFSGGTHNSTTSLNTRRSVLHLGRTEAPATVADLFQNDLVILKHVVVW
jgi:hypothetical protein